MDGDFVFPNSNQPLGSGFPESIFIDNLDANRFYNMIGIKVGDVNNSAQSWNLLNSETREKNGNILLSLENKEVRVGEEYVVAFRANDFKEIVALQFTLNFDKEKLNYTGFKKGVLEEMSEQNIGTRFLENGKLTFAWTTSEGENINDDEPLFFLKFQAKQEGNLSEMLQINSSKTEAIAYDDFENIYDVNLIFEGKEATSFLEIFPTLTNDNIFVNLHLEKASPLTIQIYNVEGVLLQEFDFGKKQAGMHVENLSLKGFTAGMYFVFVKMEEGSAVRKVVKM